MTLTGFNTTTVKSTVYVAAEDAGAARQIAREMVDESDDLDWLEDGDDEFDVVEINAEEVKP